MKRTIEVPRMEVSRHHTHSSSLSSIGSLFSDLDSSAWLPEHQHSPQLPPIQIAVTHHAEPQSLERCRDGPEMLAILSSSSPEIHALCKSGNFSSSSTLGYHHHRRSSSIGSNISAASSSIGSPSPMKTTLSEEVAQRLDRPIPNRVSLSPTMSLPRSPLQDITDDLVLSFASIHIPSSSSSSKASSSVSIVDEESNKENIPPLASSACRYHVKASPKSRRPPKPSPTHSRRWSLHRRISFDSLPSPREIGSSPGAAAGPPQRNRPRHRRNTRHVCLPRSKSPSLCTS
jgi:hypothetical protein